MVTVDSVAGDEMPENCENLIKAKTASSPMWRPKDTSHAHIVMLPLQDVLLIVELLRA
jgi:hypothetical protein